MICAQPIHLVQNLTERAFPKLSFGFYFWFCRSILYRVMAAFIDVGRSSRIAIQCSLLCRSSQVISSNSIYKNLIENGKGLIYRGGGWGISAGSYSTLWLSPPASRCSSSWVSFCYWYYPTASSSCTVS